VHIVDCIWFKSLDCEYTWTLLNTHCTCSYIKMFTHCPRHCRRTSSHAYHGSSTVAFLIQTTRR